MVFKLLKVYTYINYHINLSVSSIQHDRFVRERSSATQTGNSYRYVFSDRKKSHSAKLRVFLDDCLWMLESNQLSMLDMIMFASINSVLIINLLIAVCYICRPRERDPVSGEHLDPVLRFFETTIHWYDTPRRTDDSGKLHQLLIIMCLPFLCRRAESILALFNKSKLNRYQYDSVDITQINVAQIDALTIKSLRDFPHFLLECRRHKCERRFVLRTPRGAQMKSETNALMTNASKMDWLYYHNLISFDECFERAISKHMVEPNQLSNCLADVENPTNQSLTGRFLALCGKRKSGEIRYFVARPFHRFDPQILFFPALLYVIIVAGAVFVIPACTLIYCYPVLRSNGLDGTDSFGYYFSTEFVVSLSKALANSICDPNSLLELIEMGLYILCTGIHLTDSGFLVHDAMIEYSRANAVIDMLKVEVLFHDVQVDAFYRNSRLSKSDYFEPEQKVPLVDCYGRQVLANGQVKKSIRIWSKMCSSDKARILEFNENIKYLLNLVRILQCEQRDLKCQFTWKLNLSVMAGICGLSIAWSLLLACKTIQQFFVVFLPTSIIVMPITFALFVGATSEGSFRKITQTIRPLMVNELQLVERELVRELQKEYAHMSAIGNRSFMILGGIPLTFGSLTSIIGWVATFNLLFQQYVS